MKHQPLLITESRVEAFTASALHIVCWLFGIIVRHGFSGRSRKLREALSHAERLVERTLFLHAVAHMGPLPNRKPHRISARTGFRVAHSHGHFFYKRANVRARKAGIIDRVFALLDALQTPERAIAYFLKRIRKGLRSRRLVIAAPAADAIISTHTPVQLTLDTS
ncbi:MAG: hypothetical protein ABL932_19995 [Terricaulis sp.]